MASAGARAYKGGLGAVPPVGSRGKAPGQGDEVPLKLAIICNCKSEFFIENLNHFVEIQDVKWT